MHRLFSRERRRQRCTTVLFSVTIALTYAGRTSHRRTVDQQGVECDGGSREERLGREWHACVRGRVGILESTISQLLALKQSCSAVLRLRVRSGGGGNWIQGGVDLGVVLEGGARGRRSQRRACSSRKDARSVDRRRVRSRGVWTGEENAHVARTERYCGERDSTSSVCVRAQATRWAQYSTVSSVQYTHSIVLEGVAVARNKRHARRELLYTET